VGGTEDLKAIVRERHGDKVPNRLVIINDQHAHDASRSPIPEPETLKRPRSPMFTTIEDILPPLHPSGQFGSVAGCSSLGAIQARAPCSGAAPIPPPQTHKPRFPAPIAGGRGQGWRPSRRISLAGCCPELTEVGRTPVREIRACNPARWRGPRARTGVVVSARSWPVASRVYPRTGRGGPHAAGSRACKLALAILRSSVSA